MSNLGYLNFNYELPNIKSLEIVFITIQNVHFISFLSHP